MIIFKNSSKLFSKVPIFIPTNSEHTMTLEIEAALQDIFTKLLYSPILQDISPNKLDSNHLFIDF